MIKKTLYSIFAILIIATLLFVFIENSDEVSFDLGASGFKYVAFAFILIVPVLVILLVKSSIEKEERKPSKREKVESIEGLFTDDINQIKVFDSNTEVEEPIEVTQEVITQKEVEKKEAEPVVEKPKEETEVVETNESRFYMLTQIDERYKKYNPPLYNNEITLYDICEEFRNYACNRLKLYYCIEDIRRFIAGLSVTKLIILQGMSGTGKTSLAYAFGEFLANKTVVVPIQPMWKERTDLIGYYNEFTKKFNETTLLYTMYEANNNSEIYITVLDEMNIARVEYYFAEFLSLLELPNPEGRNLDVVSDVWETDPVLLHDGKLRLPINMWFIGTANNDDSTFSISDKVYDRAMVLNLDNKADPFEAPYTDSFKISSDHLQDLFVKAQKEYEISGRNLRRIKKLDNFMIETFHITFGNRIMKQIRAYVPVLVACGGTELEAIDDILARKVLRKLESKNPVYVRSQADNVCNFLDELFGTDKMVLCKEAIRHMEQNM